MKAKATQPADAPDFAYENKNWTWIITASQAGYQLDDERIAQKLERELAGPAGKFIADRYIRRIKGKLGRRAFPAERKLVVERDRNIAFYNKMTAELRKVDDDWSLLPKHLFTGTIKSAKERYSRCKKVKDDLDRELDDCLRTAARVTGVTFEQYKADLIELFSDRP
jgi:hypothetical protein